MAGIEIVEDGKTYDPEHDIWIDASGCMFVKNVFDPSDVVFLDVSGQRWVYKRLGEAYVDWDELSLPGGIESAFKYAIKKKLKSVSHSYLHKCHLMLSEFSAQLKPGWLDLSDLRMTDIDLIWSRMTATYRSFFRVLYTYLANKRIGGASYAIAIKLKGMKARFEVVPLRDVLNWHPTKGALTQEEETLLRSVIESRRNEGEGAIELGIRLYCWLLIATLKRGKQVLEMRLNCMKVIEKKRVKEYFVLMKPVKAQTGAPERWWVIPQALYLEMRRYSEIPSVRDLQQQYNRFLVIDCPSLHSYGVVDAADGMSALMRYVKSTLGLVSPRTGSPLHVTANRIRHTGATRLAYSGVPRDIIAEILEHDNPDSCQSYIDALGSELCPSMDRADRNMGSLFRQLNHVYFNGKMVEELTEQSIVIPDFSEPTPLFVGSCGRDTCKEGRCSKHPFVGCYNGCPSFLAWREADHHRALAYADKELERWREASGAAEQRSTIKEYEELRENILTVIDGIAQMKAVSSEPNS